MPRPQPTRERITRETATETITDPVSASPESINDANAALDTQIADSSTPTDFLDPNDPKNQAMTTFANNNFAIDVPRAIPSTSTDTNISKDDVFDKRDQLEKEQNVLTEIEDATTGGDSLFETSPTDFIRNNLYGSDDTNATTLQQEILDENVSRTQNFFDSIGETQSTAENTYGVAGLATQLGETNNTIAQKTKRFREQMRAFETDAAQRGVSREFVQGQRGKLEADATAELADLYIIQAAQSGNLDQARSLVKDSVDAKYKQQEAQTNAAQAQLDALAPTLNKEEQARREKLQIALDDRKSKIAEQKDLDSYRRELAVEVANNGGSQADINRVINAKDGNSALTAAGTWIGRLDRQLKNAQIAKANQALVEAREGGATEEELALTTSAKSKLDTLTQIKGVITRLKTMAGKEGAVGASLSRIPFTDKPVRGTAAAAYSEEIDRLSALLSFGNLDKLKGAMSDKDLLFLKSIGSSLSSNQSEDAFDVELARIEKETDFGINESSDTLGISAAGSVDDYLDEVGQELSGGSVYTSYLNN